MILKYQYENRLGSIFKPLVSHNFNFISVFLFFFILVLACFYLFLGEDILDSAVYNRNDNTNGHTNGVSEDGPRFDSSSPIVPEYGARTLGKTKNIFYLFIYFITFFYFPKFYIFLYFVKNDNFMCTIIIR